MQDRLCDGVLAPSPTQAPIGNGLLHVHIRDDLGLEIAAVDLPCAAPLGRASQVLGPWQGIAVLGLAGALEGHRHGDLPALVEDTAVQNVHLLKGEAALCELVHERIALSLSFPLALGCRAGALRVFFSGGGGIRVVRTVVFPSSALGGTICDAAVIAGAISAYLVSLVERLIIVFIGPFLIVLVVVLVVVVVLVFVLPLFNSSNCTQLALDCHHNLAPAFLHQVIDEFRWLELELLRLSGLIGTCSVLAEGNLLTQNLFHSRLQAVHTKHGGKFGENHAVLLVAQLTKELKDELCPVPAGGGLSKGVLDKVGRFSIGHQLQERPCEPALCTLAELEHHGLDGGLAYTVDDLCEKLGLLKIIQLPDARFEI
mmetsp:Transcript_6937/g.22347  ORF Transcript_6937/g.22347 Transcript_6937/m.22347 type:complete len:371 (-) Transcript_6937:508-1620(-)